MAKALEGLVCTITSAQPVLVHTVTGMAPQQELHPEMLAKTSALPAGAYLPETPQVNSTISMHRDIHRMLQTSGTIFQLRLLGSSLVEHKIQHMVTGGPRQGTPTTKCMILT